ncbi:MAG: outer membrane beta-barrel protein [Bryobacteraceae bacterium]
MKVAALVLLMAMTVWGQARGTVELKGSIGSTSFIDDENHLQTGGSVRIYLTRRISVEPEFQYLRGSGGHYDTILIPNVNWDFRSATRVVPYLTGGVGWMHSADRTRFFNFNHNQVLVQVGGGVKFWLSKRWYIAPEIRVGSELHARANVAIGYTFPR